MESKSTKYFTIGFSLVIFYLSFLLLKPYISSIILAVIVAYIFYPFYKKVKKEVKNENLAILLVIFSIICVIMIPIVIIVNSLMENLLTFYGNIQTIDVNSLSLPFSKNFVWLDKYILEALNYVSGSILKIFSSFVISLPEKFTSFIIFVFTVFFLFKEGKKFVDRAKTIIPLKSLEKNQLIREFEFVTKDVFYNILFSSFIQGISGFLGFYFFGIPNPLVWGLAISILSLIPVVGNLPIWVGGVVHLFLQQNLVGGFGFLVYAIIVANIYGLLTLGVIKRKPRLNPILALVGVISGIKIFGLIGIFLGPWIFSLLIVVIKFHSSNYKKTLDIK